MNLTLESGSSVTCFVVDVECLCWAALAPGDCTFVGSYEEVQYEKDLWTLVQLHDV